MSVWSSLFTSVFEGLGTKAASDRTKSYIDKYKDQLKLSRSWENNAFNEEFYKDPLQRSSAIAALTNTMDKIKARHKSLIGEQAVTNASPEAISKERDQDSADLAAMSRSMKESEDAERNALYQQHIANQLTNQGQEGELYKDLANNKGISGQQIGKTAGNIADLLASKKEGNDAIKDMVNE